MGGKKVFQLALQKPVRQWAICFDHFIFKTEAPDADSEYFQIINLSKKGIITYVSDFINDPSYQYFAYNNGKFYAANENTIKIAPVKLCKK